MRLSDLVDKAFQNWLALYFIMYSVMDIMCGTDLERSVALLDGQKSDEIA